MTASGDARALLVPLRVHAGPLDEDEVKRANNIDAQSKREELEKKVCQKSSKRRRCRVALKAMEIVSMCMR